MHRDDRDESGSQPTLRNECRLCALCDHQDFVRDAHVLRQVQIVQVVRAGAVGDDDIAVVRRARDHRIRAVHDRVEGARVAEVRDGSLCCSHLAAEEVDRVLAAVHDAEAVVTTCSEEMRDHATDLSGADQDDCIHRFWPTMYAIHASSGSPFSLRRNTPLPSPVSSSVPSHRKCTSSNPAASNASRRSGGVHRRQS